MNYAAFLRGINVGGHTVKMADLKKILEDFGLKNVKTLLASGNVCFESSRKDATKLAGDIEKELKKHYGFEIQVILRTSEELKALINADPFKGIKVTPRTRLYVTFLAEKPTSKLTIPYASADNAFRILKVTNGEVISVLELNDSSKTVDLMAIIEKEYGKKVTTRNWNTVGKIAIL